MRMATRAISEQVNTLRVITQRLTSTPIGQLPHVAPLLAGSLVSCEGLFADIDNQRQEHDKSETALLIYKLKTQISALLQDKNPHLRWVAIVLIKAIVEIGGWSVLHGCGAWVRGLLIILGKPETKTTKELCIITLTRIFMLLGDHQQLVRELVAPSLPSFITSCIRIIENQGSSKEGKTTVDGSTISVVFCALGELIPRHSTIFRPFIATIRSLILPFIASTPSNQILDKISTSEWMEKFSSLKSIAEPSQNLYVLLNICASKNTSGDEWTKSLSATVDLLHHTMDKVFRSVIEEWDYTYLRVEPNTRPALNPGETVSDFEDNLLGLSHWKGVHAGIERLGGLLHVLQAFLSNKTPVPVAFPVGTVFIAINRVLSVFPPSENGEDDYNSSNRINPEIGRDERNTLWATLPELHATALEVLLLIIQRFSRACTALSQTMLEQTLWVFRRESFNQNIRRVVFELVTNIILLYGLSFPKDTSSLFSKCIQSCCEELLSLQTQLSTSTANTKGSAKRYPSNGTSMNADSYLRMPSSIPKLRPKELSETIRSAEILLALSATYLPNGFFHSSLRNQIERTAILTKNKQAMLACVLNPSANFSPGSNVSSIIPLFTRQFSDCLEAEALLRPRMPIFQPRKSNREDVSSRDDEIIESKTYGNEISTEQDGHLEIPEPDPLKGLPTSEIPIAPETDISQSITIQPPNYLTNPGLIHKTPEPQTGSPSRKRDLDSLLTAPSATSLSIPSLLSEDALDSLLSKRQRIEIPSASKPDISIPPPPTSGYTKLGNDEGSDESNFEMPVLDTTLDTEDEDDTDEDENEGGSAERGMRS